MDVVERIRQLRNERGWSEYQLAEKSGLPQSTISSWYRKNMQPSVSSLERICEAFGITLSQFFADGGENFAISESQKQILEHWAKLGPAQQNALLEFLKTL